MREELVCAPSDRRNPCRVTLGRGGSDAVQSLGGGSGEQTVVQVLALTLRAPSGQFLVVLSSMFGHLTAEKCGFPEGGTKVVHALYTIPTMPTGTLEDVASD